MNANLSVIVFIMGEVFQSGSSQNYGPDFLLEKDVIVVSLNFSFSFYLQVFIFERFREIYQKFKKKKKRRRRRKKNT